jgi:hypothetical protein
MNKLIEKNMYIWVDEIQKKYEELEQKVAKLQKSVIHIVLSPPTLSRHPNKIPSVKLQLILYYLI